MFLKGWDLLKLGVNPVLILNVQWLGIEFEIYKKKDMQYSAASIDHFADCSKRYAPAYLVHLPLRKTPPILLKVIDSFGFIPIC